MGWRGQAERERSMVGRDLHRWLRAIVKAMAMIVQVPPSTPTPIARREREDDGFRTVSVSLCLCLCSVGGGKAVQGDGARDPRLLW